MEDSVLVAAETSLAMDALQTLDIKNHAAFSEANPILGSSPSDSAVVAYFAGTMAVTAVVWYLLPSTWRTILPVTVLAVEIPQIAHNENNIAFDAQYCARCVPTHVPAQRRFGVITKFRF